LLNGVPLNPADTYMVTVNQFLADGGDNFATFRDIDPSLRIGGGIDLDELISLLRGEQPGLPSGNESSQRTAVRTSESFQ
jgi:5'-nucleotidase